MIFFLVTEAPKMDELESKIIGDITFQLMKIASNKIEEIAQFIKIEWSADFQPFFPNGAAQKLIYFDH